MLKSTFRQIIETRCGKPTAREISVISELCERYNDIPGRTKRMQMMLNEMKSYDQTEDIKKAEKRLSLAISQYRKKPYHRYMDAIEIGVNDFISDFYAIRPAGNDIYLFIYFLFLKKRKFVETAQYPLDQIAYSYLFHAFMNLKCYRLIMPISELTKEDRRLYIYFRNRYGTRYADFPFLDPNLLAVDYFCERLHKEIVRKHGSYAEQWIEEFKNGFKDIEKKELKK